VRAGIWAFESMIRPPTAAQTSRNDQPPFNPLTTVLLVVHSGGGYCTEATDYIVGLMAAGVHVSADPVSVCVQHVSTMPANKILREWRVARSSLRCVQSVSGGGGGY
jgi:hypothetical protein